MKKLLVVLLMAVMSVTLLAGCGSDPVFDDLKNFLNVGMADVNADYENIKAELSTWETLEDDSAIAQSIDGVLLPLVNGSLEKLQAVTPATQEVGEIKAKYVKMMEAYKKAFELLSEACVTQEDATIEAGNESLGEALELLDQYNSALEELAKAHGGEIEY
ncbi:MAG: hypothetical protein IJO74_02365 [Clostridia bacterium]|nr:hypothetical protein [Clostridia bacterium]